MKKRFIKTPLIGVQVHSAKDVGTRTVNLLMGEHAGEYVRGDIMDANAVIQAFDELKGNVDNNHDSLEEIVDELHNLRDATDQSFEVFQEKAEEETANRIQGDNTLQQNIDTEKKERINADTKLNNDLTAETNRAKASENALSEDIKAEATKRENDDNTINDKLNAEVTRATAKEGEIKAEVDIINGDSTTEGSFRKAIADVVGAAPEAYDTLKEIADKLKNNDDLHAAIKDAIATKATTAALNEEIARAKAAEAENKAEITAEAARAKEVEGNNAIAIQNEESRATTAEGTINEAVNTEVERAMGQEAYLQGLVNAKADTTALTALEGKVTANTTAIDTKQPKGNYITFEKRGLNEDYAYIIKPSYYIKCRTDEFDNGKYNYSTMSAQSIKVANASGRNVLIDGEGINIDAGGDASNSYNLSLGSSNISSRSNDSSHSLLFSLNEYGVKLNGGSNNRVLTSNGSTIYITEYAKKTEIPTVPTKVSQLENDSEFIAKSVYDEKIAALEARIAALEAKHAKVAE